MLSKWAVIGLVAVASLSLVSCASSPATTTTSTRSATTTPPTTSTTAATPTTGPATTSHSDSTVVVEKGTVIAWNPSHQDDTGTDWDEYLVCGDIARRTMALLPDFTNVLSWETGMGLITGDVAALKAECDQANAAHAQIFIAVHVNSSVSSGFTGRYYTGDSSSGRYAEALLKSVAATMGLAYHPVHARSDLYVLNPGNNLAPIRVLLECGGNKIDRAWLSTEDGRQRLAAALAKAVSENTPSTGR